MSPNLDQVKEQEALTALERVRINYRWLLKLRWAAVVGQLLTIAFVIALVSADLPFVQLVVIVGVTAVTNLVLHIRFGMARNSDSKSAILNESELLAIMAFDVVLFSGLLYVTGGSENPFAIFYLVHVVLAAIILRPFWAWALALECLLCFSFVFVQHESLLQHGAHQDLNDLLHWGGLAAFSTVALTIAWFVVHINEELSKREQDLVNVRLKQSRHDRIESLVTLAAGAAHELSTPLSTIAVAAGELQHDLENLDPSRGLNQDSVADVALIRAQVKRCRDILEQMSADSGELSGEPMVQASLGELLQWILDPIPNGERAQIEIEDDLLDKKISFPRKALTRALRGLVTNALDAGRGDHDVKLAIERQGDNMILLVTDHGTGMSPEVSSRAFEPFFTTKSTGRGMGLGLYLSRSVVERLGGVVELITTGTKGTVMRASIPLFSKQNLDEIPGAAKLDPASDS